MAVPSWKLHLMPTRTRLTECVTSHFPFSRRTRRSGSGPFVFFDDKRRDRLVGGGVCCTLLRLLSGGLVCDSVGLRRRLAVLMASSFRSSVHAKNRVRVGCERQGGRVRRVCEATCCSEWDREGLRGEVLLCVGSLGR